jgi:hypothetical protein
MLGATEVVSQPCLPSSVHSRAGRSEGHRGRNGHGDETIEVWSALDALVLKAAAILPRRPLAAGPLAALSSPPRFLRAAQRALKGWPRRKQEIAIAEMIGKVWTTRVLNLEKGEDPWALLGPNNPRAIHWVRYDRKIAGRARDLDGFGDRASRKRQ